MLYVYKYIGLSKTMVGFVSQEGDPNVDSLVQWSCPHIDTQTNDQLILCNSNINRPLLSIVTIRVNYRCYVA